MKKFHFEVFNKNQAEIFPKLDFLTKEKFYLAGGTALALYLGHRNSVDFDFYSQNHFDASSLYEKIKKIFKKKVKKTFSEKDTLYCYVGEISLSFFWYQYPLIKPLKKLKGVSLASLEDIAAMKLIAIHHRPARRDYIDVFYLLKLFSLKEIFGFVKKKYPEFNQYLILRTLTYFDDLAEEDTKRAIKILDKKFSWEKAKKKIFEEVKKYQLGMIRT